MFIISPNEVINGSVDHIDIGDNTEIDCSGCTGITHLPLWPNVIEVHCNGCTGLTQLPLWPNVIIIDCYDCTGLTQLPLWSITYINCRGCTGLTQLPLWLNVTCVYCYNCPGLTQLPLWPNVNDVTCFGCTGLTQLPMWPNVEYVDCYNCTSITQLPDWPKILYPLAIKIPMYIEIDPAKKVFITKDCCVCAENQSNIVFSECYHQVCCEKCSVILYRTTCKCPMCKISIGSLIKRI
jgi:hypothetical protein